MTFSIDLRWRACLLYLFEGMNINDISKLLKLSVNSIKRWSRQFNTTGNLDYKLTRNVTTNWPRNVIKHVEEYVKNHPCFYLEEIQTELREEFGHLNIPISLPTISRALRHELKLTRKRIQKKARESKTEEFVDYKARLSMFYSYPEQLVFIDETSKDGRSAYRGYAWSTVGTPAEVTLPFDRGIRISALAAFDSKGLFNKFYLIKGFLAWDSTRETFNREKFHNSFVTKLLPHINRYPFKNSIVIIDNAKIHMYQLFVEAVENKGGIVIFLPPYSPQLNPIETGFSLLKKWIQKHANIAFREQPEAVLDIAFKALRNYKEGYMINLYDHSGYTKEGLSIEFN